MHSSFEVPVHLTTVKFTLDKVSTVEHTDARVSVLVTVLVPSGAERSNLERRAQAALRRVVDTQWSFAPPRITGETVGLEKQAFVAHARVPLPELIRLDERARAAGEEGLELSSPRTDFSLPPAKMADLLQEARVELLREAQVRARDFGRATGQDWRVVHVEFGVDAHGTRAALRSGKGQYRSQDLDPVAELEGVTAAETVILFGDVVLAASDSAGVRA